MFPSPQHERDEPVYGESICDRDRKIYIFELTECTVEIHDTSRPRESVPVERNMNWKRRDAVLGFSRLLYTIASATVSAIGDYEL